MLSTSPDDVLPQLHHGKISDPKVYDKFVKLLKSNHHRMAANRADIGLIPDIEMEIDTIHNAIPHCTKPYNQDFQKRDEIHKQVTHY